MVPRIAFLWLLLLLLLWLLRLISWSCSSCSGRRLAELPVHVLVEGEGSKVLLVLGLVASGNGIRWVGWQFHLWSLNQSHAQMIKDWMRWDWPPARGWLLLLLLLLATSLCSIIFRLMLISDHTTVLPQIHLLPAAVAARQSSRFPLQSFFFFTKTKKTVIYDTITKSTV